jgi:hypothetical protein
MRQPSSTPKRDLKSLGIRFDPEVREAIDKAARDDKRSASSLVEIATITYLREKGYLPK